MRAITNPDSDRNGCSQSYSYSNSDLHSDSDANSNGHRCSERNSDPNAYSNSNCHRRGESDTDSNRHRCRESDADSDAHPAAPRALTWDRKFKPQFGLRRRCKTGSAGRQDGGPLANLS